MYSRLEEEVITGRRGWSGENENENHSTTATLLLHTLLVCLLTVAVVLVDLLVRADVDGGSQWDCGQVSLHLSVYYQVFVFVNSYELLPDVQTLIPWIKNHLSLSGKHSTCEGKTPGILVKWYTKK